MLGISPNCFTQCFLLASVTWLPSCNTLLFESRLWISTFVSSIAQGLCFSKNRTKWIFVKINAINSSAFYEAVLLLPIPVTQAVTNPWRTSYSGSSYSQHCMHWTSPDPYPHQTTSPLYPEHLKYFLWSADRLYHSENMVIANGFTFFSFPINIVITSFY